MHKVSVIIPVYNQGQYVGEAIQSVLNQTYPEFEILIINDGSTDKTQSVIDSFSDPRICSIYQENRGLSAARNTGIRHANGSLITFLDADDLFLPEKLSLQISALEAQSEIGLVAGQAVLIDNNSHWLEILSEIVLPEDPAQLLLGNPIHVGSVLVRREWLDKAGFFDESLSACEDWDMWIRLSRAGCLMRVIPQPVSLYRLHSEQMTRGVERMRTAMLAVLDKTFREPDLPENWQGLRNVAYAAALVKAALRAYNAGLYEVAKRDLAEAVCLDLALSLDHAAKLVNQITGWVDHPLVDDPLGFLEKVYENLPDELVVLRKYRRGNLSSLAIHIAFKNYALKNPTKSRAYILKALRYQPSWLVNRGILSILMRSYLHS